MTRVYVCVSVSQARLLVWHSLLPMQKTEGLMFRSGNQVLWPQQEAAPLKEATTGPLSMLHPQAE